MGPQVWWQRQASGPLSGSTAVNAGGNVAGRTKVRVWGVKLWEEKVLEKLGGCHLRTL